MGQATMALREAAETSNVTVEALAREAFDGRLKLHPLPPCPECEAKDGKPCEPTCTKAGTQIVWLGDWLAWHRNRPSAAT